MTVFVREQVNPVCQTLRAECQPIGAGEAVWHWPADNHAGKECSTRLQS